MRSSIQVAAVEEKLARRVELKRSRDFEAADALQAELLAMGIWLNDRQRTWEASNTGIYIYVCSERTQATP